MKIRATIEFEVMGDYTLPIIKKKLLELVSSWPKTFKVISFNVTKEK